MEEIVVRTVLQTAFSSKKPTSHYYPSSLLRKVPGRKTPGAVKKCSSIKLSSVIYERKGEYCSRERYCSLPHKRQDPLIRNTGLDSLE